MKQETFIRGVGEMDDRILERYHAIDTRLAQKHTRKALAVRVLAVAACLAILLCACVPVGMLAHPAGRAVLKGDSEALTQELIKIDGFALWQDKMAEKLEQTLPQPLWTLMQDLPVVNVLTQSQFAGLSAQDTLEDGKPYRLYFVSGGDGTCTLEYVTTDPAFTENFVIEIPETSPAGDVVTAIDIHQPSFVKTGAPADFPYVLTAADMVSLCETAKANGISDFDYARLAARYLKLSVAGLDENARQELLDAYPIVAFGDIYVFDAGIWTTESNKIYASLTEYCEWNEEKYAQSIDALVKLAKKSDSREQAELCLTVLRSAALRQVVGISIPKTVSSINNAVWRSLPSLETVTVAEENPTLEMIDGCLVDTDTGTLKLYLREDGKFPENADIRVLDSHAFALCDLQLGTGEVEGEVTLQLPEGITEIKKNCFEDVYFGEAMVVNIHLPASLSVFGGQMQDAYYYHYLVFCYPGTMEEWESGITFGNMDRGDYIYLRTTDATSTVIFQFPTK